MQKIDFEKFLNKEQLAAATAPDGPLLVLAAAGTGKTRTLVYRVAYLVEKGISPDRLLLLTFTNRAAQEMLERAMTLVGARVGGMWAGTFHHMANRILRRYAALMGLGSNNYTILDRDDSLTLVSNCVKERNLQCREFPKPAVLLELFSSSVNTEVPLGDVIQTRFSEFTVDAKDIMRVHKAYEDRKRKLDAFDFDDLLVNCLRLLREKQDVAKKYQKQFLHVLVDEYQDTNTLQAEIVDRIAAENRNVLVVGDDFQSIYSWRGADFRNIMSFPERYPDTRTYMLETNYRSVPEILNVANACIAGNPEQFQKTLCATREPYKKPRVLKVRDGEEQARYVVNQIRELCRDGYSLSDIAVLYRAHYHAMELQMLLTRERIPYVITSGVKFFEQMHIKDVCSVLRILENSENEMAFSRLLRLLPGVGTKTAATIWNKCGNRFDVQSEAQRSRLKKALPPSARDGWENIELVLRTYKDENLATDGGEVIYRFLKSFYEQYAIDTYEDFDRRIDDIRELALYMVKFESVERFLSDVALLTNLDSEIDNLKLTTQNALRLSTIHQAKGLEWSAVILLWVTEGMFPSPRTINESSSGESEERRLFYVAITRAKDELLMCVPEVRRSRDGGVIYCKPSRFVAEMPPHLLQEVRAGFV